MTLQRTERVDWSIDDTGHVPYRVFTDPGVFDLEQERIFRGPTWTYLGLEAEVPDPGAYLMTSIGTLPVVLTRDQEGALHSMVNRCLHRGAMVVRQRRGTSSTFRCLYHGWSYRSDGSLIGIPFAAANDGCSGYEGCAEVDGAGLPVVRVTTFNGLVFGTLSDSTVPLADYLGIAAGALRRVFDGRRLEVLGYLSQKIRANWKLYFENTKDPYHGGLLHPFAGTFGLYRSSMTGETRSSPWGVTALQAFQGAASQQGAIREKSRAGTGSGGWRLQAPELLDIEPEFGDSTSMCIQTIFPGAVTQQFWNSLAIRRIIPLAVDSFEMQWTFFGYETDPPDRRRRRLDQTNLFGPSGYFALEDAEALEVVQRAIEAAGSDSSLVAMGGSRVDTDHPVASLTDENAIRAMWRTWRQLMEV